MFLRSHAALSICSATGIFLICFATGNVSANPLASAEATIPRTEVLFSTGSSNTGSAENTTQSTVKMNGTNICMTKGCVKASALILDLIDENVDPCENFYEFACGKFLKNTFIPDDKIAMMSFVQVQDKVLGQLRSVLNERSLPNESKPFTLAKTFNVACMDEQTLEEKGEKFNLAEENKTSIQLSFQICLGITPMVEILERYGGWPVVKGENWAADSWEWPDANLNISNDGLDDTLLFALAILTDQKNSSTRILDVSLSLLNCIYPNLLNVSFYSISINSLISLNLACGWSF